MMRTLTTTVPPHILSTVSAEEGTAASHVFGRRVSGIKQRFAATASTYVIRGM